MKRRLVLIGFLAALISVQFADSALAGYGYKPGYKPYYSAGQNLFPKSNPLNAQAFPYGKGAGGLDFSQFGSSMMQTPPPHPRTTEQCRSRSLLAIFGSSLTCGQGIAMPGFIDGDCPISACIIRVQSGKGSFGGPINF